jgi:salicylate hydroxylase
VPERIAGPIVIVGGGIGGLTTALALGRRGIPVRVLEQSSTLGAIGYGIQLGPNVLIALERLGLKDAVVAASHLPPAILMLDASTGDEIVRIPTGDSFRRRFTHPYVVIHRVDLHEILLEACQATPGIELSAATTMTDFEDMGDRVRVRTEGGDAVEGTALIAADGLHSRVRATLKGAQDRPRPIGYAAHRTVVPRAGVPPHVFRDEVILWAGPGFHIVAYPLRRGTVYNIVAVFRTATHGDKQDPAAYKRELIETYRDAHPDMKVLLGLMALDRRWPIADHDPIRHWSRGRVTLLGDAAHATLQSLAQGAGMAIEDGVCVADLLAEADGDIATAFRRYEAARRTRTARVQLESRALWELYHCADIEADVRRATYGNRSEAEHFACLAWLYDGTGAAPAR